MPVDQILRMMHTCGRRDNEQGVLHERVKVVEIIGTSTESSEDAGLTAVKKARDTIRNLRVAEVLEQDLDLDENGGATFRTKLRVSFKYEDEALSPSSERAPVLH